MNETALADIVLELGVRSVQRTRNGAGPLAFRLFAQIDQRDVHPTDEPLGLNGGKRPASARHILLMQPLTDVGGNRNIHHFRVGQVEARHQRRILIGVANLKARIEALFLADGADGVALVVVRGEDERLFGQPHEALQALVLGAGIAVLEVGAAGAADQERIAGEHAVAEMKAIGIVGVAGGIEHVEAQALDAEPVAVGDPHRDDVDLALLAHHCHAARAVAQRPKTGDVVGVQMRVDRFHQPKVELLHQLEVAVDLLQHRIDDERLASAPAGENVAVGARDAVEQLPEDHERLQRPRPPRPASAGRGLG